jgi:hypothetical protein
VHRRYTIPNTFMTFLNSGDYDLTDRVTPGVRVNSGGFSLIYRSGPRCVVHEYLSNHFLPVEVYSENSQARTQGGFGAL